METDISEQTITPMELFRNCLINIGFPKADELKDDDLEWMFADKSSKLFLNWFIQSVGSGNVVTDDELEKFAELDDVDDLEVEREMEDDLYRDNSHIQMHQDERSLGISITGQRMDEISHQSSVITHEHRILSIHLSTMEKTLTNLQQITSQLSSEFIKQVEEICSGLGMQIPAVLSSSLETLDRQMDVLQERPQILAKKTLLHACLFQNDVEPFISTEKAIMEELNLYFYKQFNSPVVFSEVRKENSARNFITLSSACRLVSEFSMEDLERYNENIVPLMLGIPKARIAKMKNFACCRGIQMQIELLKQYAEKCDPDKFLFSASREQVENLQKYVEVLDGKVQHLTREINQLIEENMSKHLEMLLVDEYRTNLLKSEYYLDKKLLLINQLTHQFSRMTCFLAILNLEEEECKQKSITMQNIVHMVNEELNAFHQRKDAMKEILESKNYSIFVAATNVIKILATNVEDQELKESTLSCLNACVSEVSTEQESLLKSLPLMQEQLWKKINELERKIQKIERAIFGNATDQLWMHVLEPPRKVKEMMALTQAKLSIIEKRNKRILLKFQEKRKSRVREIKDKETSLFVKYYTDPRAFLLEMKKVIKVSTDERQKV